MYISLFESIAAREKALFTVVEQKSLQKETPVAKEKKSVPGTVPSKVVNNQNFEEAVEKYLHLLDDLGQKKPADEALYNLGLIYAHGNNPAKDYGKSQNYFDLLTKQFPDSELAEEAKIWLDLFGTIEKIQQIDIEIDHQRKQLTN